MSRVYFIKPIGMQGPVKIGCSMSPDRRRETLRYWSPFPLEIVAELDGDGSVERQFHALFVDSHVSHEWFNWSAELQAVIDAIAGGTFDMSALPDPSMLPRKSKDLSYITPGWKYRRSVVSRLDHLRWNRKVNHTACEPVFALLHKVEHHDDAQLAALRETVEPMLVALKGAAA